MLLRSFDRLDRYALRLFAVPLIAGVATMLVATMLGRLLRLFDIAASTGAAPPLVLLMAADLLPHYLGLALPVAFTAATFMATARMCDDRELDIMLSTGRSIARIAAPYFVLALLLSVSNLYLFGRLQPLARYDYHVKMDRALQTNWDARIEENRFIDIAHGFSFRADAVDEGGRSFRGVFMSRRDGAVEEITTAERGWLEDALNGRGMRLRLEEGMRMRTTDAGEVTTTRFTSGYFQEGLPSNSPFRERGAAANERTLPELWQSMCKTCEQGAAAEFHSRLARAMLPPLLPLLAFPLGMAAKRGRRTPGIVFASVALLLLNHSLQFGKSLAEAGRVPAAVAVWTPYLVFALLSVWIFRGSLAWPGDNPVSRAVARFEGLLDRARAAAPRQGSTTNAGIPSYLRRRVGSQILLLLLAIAALIQVLELMDVMTGVLKRDQGLSGVLYYGLLRTPSVLVMALPPAVLIGTLLALHSMARTLEITSMRACGVGVTRMLGYLLPLGCVLAIAQFALSEAVLPGADNDLKEWWSASAPADDVASRLWAPTKGGTAALDSVSPDGRLLKGVRLYVVSPDGLIARRLVAREARWNGKVWLLRDVSETRLVAGRIVREHADEREWDTNLRPDDVIRLDVDHPRLSSTMLAEVIAGTRAGTLPHRYYQTVFYRSFTAPLGVFVMLLLALPTACLLPRSTTGGRAVALALVLGLGYLLFDGLIAAFGTSARWPPLLIALAAPALFVAIGLLQLHACEHT